MAEAKTVTGADAVVVLVDEGEGFGRRQRTLQRGEALPENVVDGEEARLEKAGAFDTETKAEVRYAHLTGSRNIADPEDKSNRPEQPVETFDVNLFGPPPGLPEALAETQESGDKNLAEFRARQGLDEEGNPDKDSEPTKVQEDAAQQRGNRRAGSTTAEDGEGQKASESAKAEDGASKKSTKSK